MSAERKSFGTNSDEPTESREFGGAMMIGKPYIGSPRAFPGQVHSPDRQGKAIKQGDRAYILITADRNSL